MNTPPPRTPVRRLDRVLLLTAFIAVTNGFGVYLFPAIFGAMRAELSLSYAVLGVISSLVQVSVMVNAIAAGALSMRVGAVPVVLGALATCSACLLGMGLATNAWTVGALVVLLSGCATLVWVTMVELAREFLAPEHRSRSLGLIFSGTNYGVFVNSLLMVSVLPALGWRWVWTLCAALVALLAGLAWWRLRGLTLPAPSGPADSGAPPQPLGRRLRALATPTTALLLAITGLEGLACTPFQTYLSALVLSDAGLADADAAFAWRLLGLCGMVSGVGIGLLAQRISVRTAQVLTHLVLAAACLAIVNLTWLPGRGMLAVAAMAFGTAFYAMFGLMPAYISERYGKGDAALVFAMTNIAMGLGGMAGNLAVGVRKEASGSFTSGYLAMGGAATLAALLCLALPALCAQRPRQVTAPV